MGRHLFIVSGHHKGFYDHLIERFHDDEKVEVILDRRTVERRAARVKPVRGDRRAGDRRRRLSPDDDLNMRSHIILTLES